MANIDRRTNSFTSPTWREVVGNMSSWTDTFSPETGEATLVGDVEWEDSNYIIQELLGVHETDTVNKRILRYHPIRHWYWNNLFCTNISMQGVRFDGSEDTLIDTKFHPIGQAASYTRLRLTATFGTLPFRVLDDGQVAVGQEYKRYLQVTPKPKFEFITRTAGVMKWADTAAGGPAANTTFPGEFNQLEAKTTYELKWWYVPENYISDPTLQLPVYTKIMAAAGTVNSDTFMGVTAYKLLLLEPSIYRFPYPLKTYPQTEDDGNEFWMCHVTLPMVYFSPTSVSAGTTGYHGHLVKPFFNTTSSTVTYYGVRSDGSAGGLPVYQTSAFADIFKAWNG